MSEGDEAWGRGSGDAEGEEGGGGGGYGGVIGKRLHVVVSPRHYRGAGRACISRPGIQPTLD